MRSLQFCFNNDIGGTDIALGQALLRDDFVRTAIHTSLFTNRRAVDDEIPVGVNDPQGYWGDTVNGKNYGSLLWTLVREKITAETLARVRAICLEALQWLVSEAHVEALDVIVNRTGATRVEIIVRYTANNSSNEQVELINAL